MSESGFTGLEDFQDEIGRLIEKYPENPKILKILIQTKLILTINPKIRSIMIQIGEQHEHQNQTAPF